MTIATTALSLVIVTSAMAPVTEAPTIAEAQLTPFEITSLAYRGSFNEAGIPGYGALESGIATGTIVAEDVIEAAIASDRLSAEVLEDSSFVGSVNNQLENLVDRN